MFAMLGGLARRFANLAHLAFGGSCYLCRGAARGVLCADCDAELPRLAPLIGPLLDGEIVGVVLVGDGLVDLAEGSAAMAAEEVDRAALGDRGEPGMVGAPGVESGEEVVH